MATNDASTSVITDAMFYDRVCKDSDERLRSELITGQNFFTKEQIVKLSRRELIENVTKLRKISGQLESVKTVIVAFDPKQISVDRTGTSTPSTPSTPGNHPNVTISSVVSPRSLPQIPSETSTVMSMFLNFMQSQTKLQQEENERREAREVEQRKLEQEQRRLELELQKDLRTKELEMQLTLQKTTLEAAELARLKESQLAEQRHQENILLLRAQNELLKQSNEVTREIAKEEREQTSKESERMDIRLERAHKRMRPLLYQMPGDVHDLTLYLDNMEKIFDQNEIADDLRIALLTPYLTESARRLLLGLPSEDINSYVQWKNALLREHRLTSYAYRQSYLNATRNTSETWIQFSTRLSCLLRYYLMSRGVENSYETLFNLLLSDKMKDSLPNFVRHHVADKEGSDWYKASKIGEIVDLYETERNKTYTSSNSTHAGHRWTGWENGFQESISKGKDDETCLKKVEPNNFKKAYKPIDWRQRITCFTCSEKGHVSRECTSGANTQRARGGGMIKPTFPQRTTASTPEAKTLRKCFICNDTSHLARNCPKKKFDGQGRARRVKVAMSNCEVVNRSNTDHDSGRHLRNEASTELKTPYQIKRVEAHEDEDFVPMTAEDEVQSIPRDGVVYVDFGAGSVKCIVDSGADVTVLHPKMIPVCFLAHTESSNIFLEAAFGQRTTAKLINLPACLVESSKCKIRQSKVLLTCAVTAELNGDSALVTMDDYEVLKSQADELIPSVRVLAGTKMLYDDPNDLQNRQSHRLETQAMAVMDMNALSEGRAVKKLTTDLPLSTDQVRIEEVVEFQKLQMSDATIKSCWDTVGKDKSSFTVHQGNQLLYHTASVGGFKISQLVVPESKRRQILEKAHDSDWAMHFGTEKTLRRIESYFYWPSMSQEVKEYVKSCVVCQKSARKTKYDRVPISSVARAATSFEHVNIDLIGPIVPKSSRGHNYILCLIDNCSRWADAVPLRSLTAKELCDALMTIFCHIGIPRIVVSDNGTNMISGLTQELYARLGIELRRSTAYHPQGNGLVERFNQSLKHMLHQVVKSENPRDWDRRLPYLLWAYREIPNATTGLSPYQLVYGRASRGPLSVLRDTWAGDLSEVPMLSNTSQQYLEELKRNLEIGLNLAEKNASKAQKSYTDQHNNIAKEKEFNVGDMVLVLMPDSTNKLMAEWQGPATIVARVSPHSYRIALDTGAVKVLHANHLRPFIARVDAVGVIFEDDEDFGKIEYCPTSLNNVSEELKQIDLSHLSEIQRNELLNLLQKYKHVFSDKPGCCNVTHHEINLEENFKPKSMHPYRIPDRLKVEVNKQIDELLKAGKIRPSRSPYGHPIVCVAKPNGDIRVCTDLRHVNSGTINDAYPMPRAEDLLMKVSSSTFLSTLDCTSGYWQIPVRECDIPKTAFITHRGLFEWVVMPFGCKTAGNTFQRVVDGILTPHMEYASAYIDDTIIHSAEWKEHLQHLEAVFQSFDEAGMTLKLSKCVFGRPSVKFIGHEVGSGQRVVVKSKVEAIKSIPEPHNKKLLRSFLGMTNFYRNYIPDYSKIALPLTDLTRNSQGFSIKFNERERAAFLALKEALCNSVTLYSPRQDLPFIIRTDASDYAVGACLSQIAENGNEMPVAFASAKLSDVQSRWSTIEKEAYAVIFALQKFDIMVYGARIELFSDHNPLQYLVSCVPKSAKLTRWALSLCRYNINVHHIKGTENVSADFLSRCTK